MGATTARSAGQKILADSLQPFVEKHQIAGGVGLMAKANTLEIAAVGYSDLAQKRLMREDDLFWIASMTKPMAAVCVLMLQDAGKLSVEDPVEKHLPEFKGQWLMTESSKERRTLVPAPRPITIRDLLTHTSGLGDMSSPRFDSTLAELVTGYAREPLQFQPGSRWSYCNSGINTLGRIVEAVSGIPFATFLDSRLLHPLGMVDTTFWLTQSQTKRLAKSYKAGANGQLEEVSLFFMNGNLSDRRRTPLPAGGLFSTAKDVAQFYRMMLNRGATKRGRILSESAVQQMTTTQTGDIKTGFVEGMSWGLGFQVVKEPTGVTAMLSKGTFGHGGAYATQSWADPVRGISMVLMIQRSGLPNGDASDMRRALQEAAVKLV
jgi:CubicO group peptidase (beta-lactamase class C family)